MFDNKTMAYVNSCTRFGKHVTIDSVQICSSCNIHRKRFLAHIVAIAHVAFPAYDPCITAGKIKITCAVKLVYPSPHNSMRYPLAHFHMLPVVIQTDMHLSQSLRIPLNARTMFFVCYCTNSLIQIHPYLLRNLIIY
jgi:hypothetical protein